MIRFSPAETRASEPAKPPALPIQPADVIAPAAPAEVAPPLELMSTAEPIAKAKSAKPRAAKRKAPAAEDAPQFELDA
ncbi:hypothetical protein F4V91_08025 [Neorhizobium galegae]|uniref:Uncharacterized protein n=1 Tax=Neorhizobium galegae TaxID=399 RepID=A0A6A1TNW4_NEOGA|nr:hypothetical protein [Neorhizobium galegae]KAB1086382.1 hypothetical protein F4V91_08025 [Neorhizobium galegae]